jgi:hypothetical protein
VPLNNSLATKIIHFMLISISWIYNILSIFWCFRSSEEECVDDDVTNEDTDKDDEEDN